MSLDILQMVLVTIIAAATPLMIAADWPQELAWRSTRSAGVEAAVSASAAAVPSVEPSST